MVNTEPASFIDYWPTGLVKKVTQPDGSFVAYDYDDAHRLVEISDATGNRIAYTLDGAGNRLSETVYDPFDTVSYSRTYQYDALGRLIEEQGAQGQTTSYTYDQGPYGAGRLTEGVGQPEHGHVELRRSGPEPFRIPRLFLFCVHRPITHSGAEYSTRKAGHFM